MTRYVCKFSCGAASAVATKLAIGAYGLAYEVLVVNAFLREEHPDNRRFLADCVQWFGQEIVVVRDEKYNASAREVFRRKRYTRGMQGAPCSRALKRDYDARDKAMHRMSHGQWHYEEIATGEPFARIKAMLQCL